MQPLLMAASGANCAIHAKYGIMNIEIHQKRRRINFVNRSEKGLSFKHRQGHKPNEMRQTVYITGLPDRISTRFKSCLTLQLKKCGMRHDVPCVVITPFGKFESHSRRPHDWANKLANVILLQIKGHKDAYGVASKESVLKLAGRQK